MIEQIHESWRKKLVNQTQRPYFIKIQETLKQEETNYIVCPNEKDIYRAFLLTPFYETKVVILGQDPYHGLGQAHGLSFSVQKGIKIPPSLRNIYKEIENDLGYTAPPHGDLSSWAKQGVLLLNSILTVREKQPASHRNMCWEIFTDEVIRILSREQNNLVFMLWGNYAKQKSLVIENKENHLLLEAAHPSPFSAHRGFFGTNHFSKANEYLQSHGLEAIDWQIE